MSDLLELLKSRAKSKPSKAQGIEWFPSRWQRVFDGSPLNDILDQVIAITGAECGKAMIKRDQAFQKYSNDLRFTFLATMIWGRGDDNRGPKVTIRMMQDCNFDNTVKELSDTARSKSPQVAFEKLFIKRRTRLPRLGVSFGTKVIHAFGYRQKGLQPLVYDLRVYQKLKALYERNDYPSEPKHPWRFMTGEPYGLYCEWAADLAHELECEPGDVECALYERKQ